CAAAIGTPRPASPPPRRARPGTRAAGSPGRPPGGCSPRSRDGQSPSGDCRGSRDATVRRGRAGSGQQSGDPRLRVERAKGIEPPPRAWEEYDGRSGSSVAVRHNRIHLRVSHLSVRTGPPRFAGAVSLLLADRRGYPPSRRCRSHASTSPQRQRRRPPGSRVAGGPSPSRIQRSTVRVLTPSAAASSLRLSSLFSSTGAHSGDARRHVASIRLLRRSFHTLDEVWRTCERCRTGTALAPARSGIAGAGCHPREGALACSGDGGGTGTPTSSAPDSPTTCGAWPASPTSPPSKPTGSGLTYAAGAPPARWYGITGPGGSPGWGGDTEPE